MRSFAHINARSVDEAVSILSEYRGKAVLNAGGTDLLGVLKDEILPAYPEVVINIKTIAGLDFIRESEGGLRIGSLARISDIVRSALIRQRYSCLSQAAHAVATPQIRNAATIGGNLCQDVRCWYYRYPRQIGGPIQCLRKGKGPCLAVRGDNRYHALVGAKGCFAVCPSDIAVALAALDATIHITGPQGDRTVAVNDFFTPLGHNLNYDEIVREVEIPTLDSPAVQNFLKFTLRKPVDFAIVNVATVVIVRDGVCTDARVSIGAVAPGPVRERAVEKALVGRPLTETTVSEAAEKAVSLAKPLRNNSYKVAITKTLIRRALLGGD